MRVVGNSTDTCQKMPVAGRMHGADAHTLVLELTQHTAHELDTGSKATRRSGATPGGGAAVRHIRKW